MHTALSKTSFIRYEKLIISLPFSACLAFDPSCPAASTASRPPMAPIERLYAPRDVRIEVVPRSLSPGPGSSSSSPRHLKKRGSSVLADDSVLLASDALRLSFDLPRQSHLATGHNERRDQESTFDRIHLHLRPNTDLFHPRARLNHLSADGAIVSSEPLDASDHLVYSGEVVHAKHTEARLAEDHVGGGMGLWYAPGSEGSRGVRGWASVHLVDASNGGGMLIPDVDPIVFQGALSIDGQVWHVLTADNYAKVRGESDADVEDVHEQGGMVFFPETGQSSSHGAGCRHDHLDWNVDPLHPVLREHRMRGATPDALTALWAPSLLLRRDDISSPNGGINTNYIDTIGQTDGCPKEQKVVYVGVAADCSYTQKYGGANATRTQIINNFNSVSSLYRSTFNISVGIIELNVLDASCPTASSATSSTTPWNTPCSADVTLNDRLSLFSQWRPSQNKDAGLYHLMTACPTDTEVGVAWLGTLCQTTASQQGTSWVSGTGVSSISSVEWSLTAHEMGHNFGAIHDCTDGCSLSGTCCPLSTSTCSARGQYIMNPTTSSSEIAFSPCSIGNICSVQQSRSVDTSCLVTPGSQTSLSLQQCGNGIVEEGEDCDPGSNSTSSCCDASTCKFINGAVCDPASDACCTGQCTFASNSTICRPSIDSACDQAEYCTGTSRTCPADVHTPDGDSCGNGLACASGQCTSLNRQCQWAGSSLGLSTACGQRNDRSCIVTCQSPNNTQQCIVLNSPLIDGSPCGYGGRCYNSTCQTGSLNDTVSSWYKSNLQIAIPVTVIAGLLALALLFSLGRCIFCGGCCGARRTTAPKRVSSTPNDSVELRRRQSSWMAGPPPLPPPPPPPRHQMPQQAFYPGPPQHYGGWTDPHYQPSGGFQQHQQPPGNPGWVDDRMYNGAAYREH